MLEDQRQDTQDDHQYDSSHDKRLWITVEGKYIRLRSKVLEHHPEWGSKQEQLRSCY